MAEARPSPELEHRLVLLVGAVMFVDTMFFAAIAPLLPTLAHELRLSKLSSGVLTASYPVGMLAGSLPSGVLVTRVGPKATVCAGLALMAGSTVAFALFNDTALLDLARLVEGVGGACSWAGGIAWIVAEAPATRRGALIGSAVGAAIGGALFGPIVGTAATAVGRPAAFGAVVVLAVALIWASLSLPDCPSGSEQGMRHMIRALRNKRMAVGFGLVTLPSLALGTINVLGPLRLHRLGAGAAAIGAVFVVATALEALLSPIVGRLSDRRGRLWPLRFGLGAAGPMLLLFTIPRSALGLAFLIVGIAVAVGTFWAPAMALMSDAAETSRLDQALAAVLMNVAWAVGQILGASGSGAIAKETGDGLPVALVGGLCVLTLALLVPWVPRRQASAATRAP